MSEELRIIMETIGQLGQAGKEAFIWWLIVKYVLHYLTVSFFLLIAGFVAVRIIAAVKAHQEESRIVSEIAIKAGVRAGSWYSPTEYNQLHEWVRKQ